MGFRFRKSINLLPGVKLNLNKKSTSVTLGGKGFHKTFSSTGRNTTSVGIPGTGLSYTTTSGTNKKNTTSSNKASNTTQNSASNSSKKEPWYMSTMGIIILLFIFFPIGLYFLFKKVNWKKETKIIVASVSVLFVMISGAIGSSGTEATPDANNTSQLVANVTIAPTESSVIPTAEPTLEPTEVPTLTPTIAPTPEPTQEQQETMVYITESGTKYHTAGCSYLKDSVSEVTLDSAKSRGCSACSRCGAKALD